MKNHSFTEENYLKTIYHIAQHQAMVQTNAIADKIQTKAASVTDMLKKLANKKLINYTKYQGVSLTVKGELAALQIIRKHRLWEVFLVDKLKFKWDEVHEIAEELEHIKSDLLIEKLDEFLGFPSHDPHGDPIPNKNGKIISDSWSNLCHLKEGEEGWFVGVSEHHSDFLQHLDSLGLSIGTKIKVKGIMSYDGNISLIIKEVEKVISKEVASHILINKNHE